MATRGRLPSSYVAVNVPRPPTFYEYAIAAQGENDTNVPDPNFVNVDEANGYIELISVEFAFNADAYPSHTTECTIWDGWNFGFMPPNAPIKLDFVGMGGPGVTEFQRRVVYRPDAPLIITMGLLFKCTDVTDSTSAGVTISALWRRTVLMPDELKLTPP